MEKKDLPVIPRDRSDDLHHLEYADDADLILFMAGNQFMTMAEIVSVFQNEHPEVKKIFYETLPPGLELRQILAGGAMFGDRRLDVYTSVSEKGMHRLEESGHIRPGGYQLYLHNRLTLIVQKGNPAGIRPGAGRYPHFPARPCKRGHRIPHHGYVPAGGRRRTGSSHHGGKACRRHDHSHHCASSGDTTADFQKDCGRRAGLGHRGDSRQYVRP